MKWCPNTDLNRKPTDYKSVALPIELLGHLVNKKILVHNFKYKNKHYLTFIKPKNSLFKGKFNDPKFKSYY